MPGVVATVAFAALAALLLAGVGQPLITDDAWLHLVLGRAYASHGPWLDADPMLANALGPPTPAAWLFDVALHGIEQTAGFTGLRIFHVALVAAILALAWTTFRRAAASAAGASLATTLFIALAAYRLIQLRPHLLAILAALLLYRLVLERDAPQSMARACAGVLLFLFWANVHASFLLAPALFGVGIVSLLAAMPLQRADGRPEALRRVRYLAAVGALGTLATLLNPAGLDPHLAWFVAGEGTPHLARVGDEWSRLDLLAWPRVGLPPSPLAWALQWALVLSTAGAIALALRSWRTLPAAGEAGRSDAPSIDPLLAGASVFALVLPLIAVRFLWLGLFPLLLALQAARTGGPRALRGPAAGWIAAAATAAAAVGFFFHGTWPTIAATLPTTWAGYAQPYRAPKYHADLVWILQDAGVRGTLFTEYHVSGFASYHLAPQVRTLVNGTLNVSPEIMAANLPLRARRGERAGERFVDLLDRHAVDVYVGTRLPRVVVGGRPWLHTTRNLENAEGWIPIFRNLTGAIHVRDVPRNQDTLDRVAAFYEAEGVPFHRTTGFDPEQVIRESRPWAIRRAMIPAHFDTITSQAFRGGNTGERTRARQLLASIYVALGLYERAVELDAQRIASDPEAVFAARRLVWSLLRLGRFDEALEIVPTLEARPAADGLSHRIAEAAREAAALDDAEARAVRLAQLPVFTPGETVALTRNVLAPAARTPP